MRKRLINSRNIKIFIICCICGLISWSCVIKEESSFKTKPLPYDLVVQEFNDSTVYYKIICEDENTLIIDTIPWVKKRHSGKTEN